MMGLWLGVMFLTFHPIYLHAQTLTLDINSGDVTFVQLGNTLELDVSYTYTGGNTVIVQWTFNNTNIVGKVGGGNPQGSNPRATVRGKATLVLRNTSLSDNGTYSVEVNILGGAKVAKSFQVIIQEPSKANISCTGKGDNFSCLCEGIGGTPPARISWFKNGEKIKGPGYLQETLVKADFVKGGEGVYYCNSTSGQLADVKEITLSNVSRENISIKIDPPKPIFDEMVKITCSSTVIPTPDYILYRNGTMITSNDGVGTEKVKEKSNINYTCVATNIFSTAARSHVVEVKDEPIAKPTTNSTITNTPPKSETTKKPVESGGGGSGGLEGWVIAVIVISVLLVIVAIVFLIGCKYGWETFCCCKSNGGCSKNAEREQIPDMGRASVGGSLPRANDDAQYETVDQEKLRRATEANNGENSGAASGSLPPVYAVVDKDKKKRDKERKEKEKEKRPPQPTYASLDPVALQPDSSKMRDRSREETNYASINLDSLQSDLV